MKNIISLSVRLLLAAGLLLPAVACGRQDLVIYNLAQDKAATISKNKLWENVIDVSPERTNFYSVAWQPSRKLLLREWVDSGVRLSERELPFFVPAYEINWIALSPDHSRAVFYNKAINGLSLLSLSSLQQRELSRDLLQRGSGILLLRWLSTNTVLLLKNADLGETGQILKINADTGETQTWSRSLGIGFMAHRLSASGKFLATTDYNGKLVILDTATMKEVKEVPPPETDSTSVKVLWMNDDKQLAIDYLSDGMYCYTINTEEMKRITPKGKNDYYLKEAAGRYIILMKRGFLGKQKLTLHDVATGKSRPLKIVDYIGSIYGIAGNTKLLMEVGY